ELELVDAVARAARSTAQIRLRVRPELDRVAVRSDLAGTTVRDAARAYKAGVPLEQTVELGRRALASNHLELVGLHTHLGLHSAAVTNVKTDAERTWIETDTSEFFLFDTLAEQAFFEPVPVVMPLRERIVHADITGISCTFDVIAPGVTLPPLAPGDLLVFL